MNTSPTSGSDRQLDRSKGLARISALTLGAGAAGLVGAVAIAVTLPGSSVVSALKSTSASTLTSGSTVTGDDGTTSSSSGDDGSTLSQPQPQPQAQAQTQLQSGTAPTTTNSPPAATSGAS